MEKIRLENLCLITTDGSIAIENYINSVINEPCMDLGELAEKAFGIVRKTKDAIHLGAGYMYYTDGERYRLLGDERTYKYFKRRCNEEFSKDQGHFLEGEIH